MRVIRMTWRAAVVVVAIVSVAAGCAADDTVEVPAGSIADAADPCHGALEKLSALHRARAATARESSGASSSLPGPSRLADVLPNVIWELPGEGAKPYTTIVVIGEVEEVLHGVGVHRPAPLDDPNDQVRGDEKVIGFDDSRAYTQTLAVRVAAEEVLAGDVAEAVTVEWRLRGPGFARYVRMPQQEPDDPALVACALHDAGRAVWLVAGSLSHYDEDALGVGTMLLLDKEGRIHPPNLDGGLPFLNSGTGDEWLGEVTTLQDLRAELAKPMRRLRYDDSGRIVPTE